MSDLNTMKIDMNKDKFGILFLLSGLFLFLGYWIFSLDSHVIETHRRMNSPFFVHLVGAGCFIMGAVGLAVSVKVLFSSASGLEVNQNGLKIFSLGEFKWSEITGFKVQTVYKQRYIYVKLRNPDDYIARCNPINRVMLRAARGLTPSPVGIAEKFLDMEFEKLINLLEAEFARSKLS